MSVKLLLGDEAVAQGAIDAGISGCYAYPGTPSTEITEYVQALVAKTQAPIACQWACNEKTAMESALGMSYAGKRSIVCMKHVGMNVASDGFMNAAASGVYGGLVIVAADDPSMHSSQNEQDSRFYGNFAKIPIFEPANQQEAYDMMKDALELSEAQKIPVLFRVTTRLAHSRADVRLSETPILPKAEWDICKENPNRYILLPMNARPNYIKLLAKQEVFQQESVHSPYNQIIAGKEHKLGILACGKAINYVQEAFDGECPYPIFKLCQYPIPQQPLKEFVDSVDQLLILEDGQPVVEELLHGGLGLNPKIQGRMTGAIPTAGELTPESVAKALGLPPRQGISITPTAMAGRPPRLCQGCPHISSFNAINEVMKDFEPGHVFGDIGCYTLGAVPPFNAIYSCIDMGSSISMAKGAADAGMTPVLAVIGDSTFTHSGMTSLMDAVWANSPITVLILDNYTTGMTGGQDSCALGKLHAIVAGLGIDLNHIHLLDPMPNKHEQNVEVIRQEMNYQGLSVIIFQRECLQTLRRKAKAKAKK